MAFPVLFSDQISVKSSLGLLKAVSNTTIQINVTGTATPATLYNADGSVLSTNGQIKTDAAGNYEVWLSRDFVYDVVYKGNVFRTFDPSPDDENATAALQAHASATGGVHGVPAGETVAYLSQVTALVNGIPSSGGSGGPAYTLPTATQSVLGGVMVDASLQNTGGLIGLLQSTKDAVAAVAAKYVKPASGIPLTDLTTSIQNSINAIAGKYAKPTTGVPESDLSAGVINALNLARTSLQPNSGVRIYAGPASGYPTVGTFNVLDQAIDGSGRRWTCSSGGTNTAASWITEPRLTGGPSYPTNPQPNDFHILIA